MFALAQGGCVSVNTPLCWERIQCLLVKPKPLTFFVLVLVGLESLVVRDAPYHAGLVANHLGFDRRFRLDRLPRFNGLFLGFYNLFFWWFGWGFGSGGLFVRYFYSILRSLISSVL